MRSRRPKGLTLIDTAFAVAVLGMLFAVILPTLARVRQAALTDREKVAARLVCKAWHHYSVDNKEKVIPSAAQWTWVHPSTPPITQNTPRMTAPDPFNAGQNFGGSIAKVWTLFLMQHSAMQTGQLQVNGATRALFDARSNAFYYINPPPQSYVEYYDTSRPAAYAFHPSCGINGVFIGGAYPYGAFRGTPDTAPNPMIAGGRFYVTSTSQVRNPAGLMVFCSSRGGDVSNSTWWSYGGSDPNFGAMRPGYWLVRPPKAHPTGRGSSGQAVSLAGAWGASNAFNAALSPSTWGMVDPRNNGMATTAMVDGHVELQSLSDLRDMRKWSNYATSADWSFQPGP